MQSWWNWKAWEQGFSSAQKLCRQTAQSSPSRERPAVTTGRLCSLQGGLAGPSTLAAAAMAGLGQRIFILIVVVLVHSGEQSIFVNAVVDVEQARHRAADITAGWEVGRADLLHRPVLAVAGG